jgi:hypothetical protein
MPTGKLLELWPGLEVTSQTAKRILSNCTFFMEGPVPLSQQQWQHRQNVQGLF